MTQTLLALLLVVPACVADDSTDFAEHELAATCTANGGTLTLPKLDIIGAAMQQWVASQCPAGQTTAASITCRFINALTNIVASPVPRISPSYATTYRRILGGTISYYNAANQLLTTEQLAETGAPTNWTYNCLVDCSATLASSTSITDATILDTTVAGGGEAPAGFCAMLQTQIVAKDVGCTLPSQSTWTAPITVLAHGVPATLTTPRTTTTETSNTIPPHIAAAYPAVKAVTTYDYEVWTIDTTAMANKCNFQMTLLGPAGALDRCGQFAPSNVFSLTVSGAVCVPGGTSTTTKPIAVVTPE